VIAVSVGERIPGAAFHIDLPVSSAPEAGRMPKSV